MKKLFFISLVLAGCNKLSAQSPPFGFQSNSNLKVYVNQNIISPETWINFTGTYPLFYPLTFRITDYYQEVKQQNDMLLSNPGGNGFFHTGYGYFGANNPFASYPHDSSFIWHYAKFFFDGNSDIDIDSGIVLCTGKTFYMGHPLDSTGPSSIPGISHKAIYNSTGYNLGTASFVGEPNGAQIPRFQQYPELVALNNGRPIADANIFEFDIVPQGNFISLDYVFASEEWPHNSCDSGADVMAIMLSGPGIVGEKNIAVLPGTNTPVTTQTVYPIGTLCKEGGTAASPYYVDNTAGENVIFNGFTKVLRAASMVQPCQPYHVRVMVAEGIRHPYDSIIRMTVGSTITQTDTAMSDSLWGWSDGLMLYDSGIFLKMGSLRSTDTVRIEALGGLSQSAAHPYAMRGCFNGSFRLSVSDSLPIARTYTLQYSGTAVAGIDYQALSTTVTLPAFAKSVTIPVQLLPQGQGDKQLRVMLHNPAGSCQTGYKAYIDTAILSIVSTYPVSASPADTTICNGCSVQLHATAEAGINYTYAWTPALGLSSSNAASPIATPNVNTLYTLTITGSNGFSNCAVGSATSNVKIGTVGINEAEGANELFRVYPNPFKNNLNITIKGIESNEKLKLKVTNLLGQTIFKAEANIEGINNMLQKQSSLWSQGWYLIDMQSSKGTVQQKVIKQ